MLFKNRNHSSKPCSQRFGDQGNSAGKPIVFSIKFVKKDGELVFIPRAMATGLKMNMKENRMRGVLPVDENGNACGHVTPVSIDSLIEYNGIKVRM